MNPVLKELDANKQKPKLSLSNKQAEKIEPVVTTPKLRNPSPDHSRPSIFKTINILIFAGFIGWGAYYIITDWDYVKKKCTIMWNAFNEDIEKESNSFSVGSNGDALPFLGVRLNKKVDLNFFERIKLRFSAAYAAGHEEKSGSIVKTPPPVIISGKGNAVVIDNIKKRDKTTEFAIPSLRVSGIMLRSNPRNNLANVEGRVAGVGDIINGAKIIAINNGGIVVSFKGRQIAVSVTGR